MKNKFWAVIIKPYNFLSAKENKWASGLCLTWDIKHPEDPRKEKSVMVWAIYPKKKDALDDAKFRGHSYVKEIKITSL